jgi:hypothetical protein
MLVWVVQVVALQLRCVDTAAEVARQAARGDDQAVRRAQQGAPSGANVAVSAGADVITVIVTLEARPMMPGLPRVPLRAQATATNEPGSGPR